jgi:hypothetical protein
MVGGVPAGPAGTRRSGPEKHACATVCRVLALQRWIEVTGMLCLVLFARGVVQRVP